MDFVLRRAGCDRSAATDGRSGRRCRAERGRRHQPALVPPLHFAVGDRLPPLDGTPRRRVPGYTFAMDFLSHFLLFHFLLKFSTLYCDLIIPLY